MPSPPSDHIRLELDILASELEVPAPPRSTPLATPPETDPPEAPPASAPTPLEASGDDD